MEKARRTVVFTHIPKTAGTTINILLQIKYLFSWGYFFNSANVGMLDNFIALPDRIKRRIIMIRGHLLYGVHNYCSMPVHYFTMLREPLSRCVAHFNYLYSNTATPYYRFLHENKYTLKDTLAGDVINNIDNCQVRFLCGIKAIPFGEVNEEHLQLAIDNMTQHYERIGILEYFDESVLLFAKHFNWATPYYTQQNVNTKPLAKFGELDQETQEMVIANNKYDILLYQKALQLFQKQIDDAGPAFPAEVEKFKMKRGGLSKTIRAIFFVVRYINQAKIYLRIERGGYNKRPLKN